VELALEKGQLHGADSSGDAGGLPENAMIMGPLLRRIKRVPFISNRS
jgi:hypothetical protein